MNDLMKQEIAEYIKENLTIKAEVTNYSQSSYVSIQLWFGRDFFDEVSFDIEPENIPYRDQ